VVVLLLLLLLFHEMLLMCFSRDEVGVCRCPTLCNCLIICSSMASKKVVKLIRGVAVMSFC